MAGATSVVCTYLDGDPACHLCLRLCIPQRWAQRPVNALLARFTKHYNNRKHPASTAAAVPHLDAKELSLVHVKSGRVLVAAARDAVTPILCGVLDDNDELKVCRAIIAVSVPPPAHAALAAEPGRLDVLYARCVTHARLSRPALAAADALRLLRNRVKPRGDCPATLWAAARDALETLWARGASWVPERVNPGCLIFAPRHAPSPASAVAFDASPVVVECGAVGDCSTAGECRALARVDASSPPGRAAALAALAAARPVCIERGHVAPQCLKRWDADYLAHELGDFICHSLSAPAASRRFTYFWCEDDT